jgi:hypothetical protein
VHRVRIDHLSPAEAIELKNQLLADDLIIDQDFEWEYHQAIYANDGFTPVAPKQATFTFAQASLATFYQLKWAR